MTNSNETAVPVASRPEAAAPPDAASTEAVSSGTVRSRHARAAGPGQKKWLLAGLLVLGWLAQAGLRMWFSRGQVFPLDDPDETAYLVAARYLAGGPGADLPLGTLYQVGYPLLITPVYWFTHTPSTVYHAVLTVNAFVSAAVMPLGYVVCRRLGLRRPAAYGVAMVAALLPAAFFYSEYAISDAIFPVVTLAWLVVIHSWLTAGSRRARYAAAVGSGVMAGYAYAVHSRGDVLLVGFVAVAVFIAWRRPAARMSAAVAGVAALATVAVGWRLDKILTAALYPEGTRSLSGQLVTKLGTEYGALHVAEMGGGQIWRLITDSWGVAGIGLAAAVAVIFRRDARPDLRIMAALSVGVTVVIACAAPAALPAQQTLTWASGRYLDGMIVAFFLVGVVVLLRAAAQSVIASAAGVVALSIVAAITVAVYAGTYLPTGRGMRFNFGEPAFLTQNWAHASVVAATAVTMLLLLLWVMLGLLSRYVPPMAGVLCVMLAGVSLAALTQLTVRASQTDVANARAEGFGQMATAASASLTSGGEIAIATNVPGILREAQSFEVPSAKLNLFNPFCTPPPASATVLDVAWPRKGHSVQSSWPNAPAGWQVVASNRRGDWVVWRKSPGATAASALMGLDGRCKVPLTFKS